MNPERHEKIRRVSAQRQLDLTVVLEDVHDPHNVAAVLRTCDAVGIQTIYACYSDPTNMPGKFALGKRTSRGARKWVDVFLYTGQHQCIEDVRKKYRRLLGAALTGTSGSVYELDMSVPTAFVFGNEHKGLSQQFLDACDATFTIPQMGMAQSLNISVACAIVLYETLRQRLEKAFYSSNPTGSAVEFQSLYNDFIERHESGYKGRLPRIIE